MSHFYLFLINLIIFLFKQSNAALDCNCRLGAAKKVIGGYDSEDNFIPWNVIITENNVMKCTGFILSKRYVLTAAHCVFSKPVNTIMAVVSLNDITVGTSFQNFYNLDSINIPYDFDINKLQNGHNIALLVGLFARLNRDIRFDKGKVEVGCIRWINRKIDDLFVSGFGSTKQIEIVNGVKSDADFGNRMKYMSFYEPLKNRKKHFQYIKGIAKKKGEDTCLRDGGAPAMILTNGKAAVVGLTSFSTYKKVSNDVQTMCNGITHFTRLSYEQKFIEFYVGKNYCLI